MQGDKDNNSQKGTMYQIVEKNVITEDENSNSDIDKT